MEKQYQTIIDKNNKLAEQINLLQSQINNNEKELKNIEQTEQKRIEPDFFKKTKPVKIKISSVFDLNVTLALIKSEPIKFIEKYLKQYKPKISEYKYSNAYNIMNGKIKRKNIFSAEHSYNEPYNKFITAVPGILIEASKHDGGDYDRDWFTAEIHLKFGNEEKTLKHEYDVLSHGIYSLLRKYNEAHQK